MPIEPTGTTSIRSETLPDAWEQSVRAVLESAAPLVDTQRGLHARELLGMRIEVSLPTFDRALPARYPMSEVFVEDHWLAMSDATVGIGIASRIHRPETLTEPGLNQIEAVTKQLAESPDSRRAVVSLWDGVADANSEHPPCACIVQFLIRDNRLNVLSYFRSNDAWTAAFPDMVAMVRLGSLVAARLDLSVGTYIHFAASYHIYEADLVPALAAFGSVLSRG
jgi:Thymidylate synthase